MNPTNRAAAKVQTFWLTLVSVAAVAPYVWRRGLDVVTRSYVEGSDRFWGGVSPYQLPTEGRDWFKYSPAFAFLYKFFEFFSPSVHAVLWSILNAAVFWWGVGAWARLSRKTPWFVWVALVAAAMELDISMRYQQVNGLLAGLTVLGLARYNERRFNSAGAALGIAANFKILPTVFTGALLWPWKKEYARAVGLSLLALFLLPVLRAGFARDLDLHREWLGLLTRNLNEPGLLDLRTVLTRLGAPAAAVWWRGIVAVGAVVIFGGYRLLRHARADFNWGAWYAFGTCSLLLLSPRTESPTFVLLAPAYLLLAQRLSERVSPANGRRTIRILGAITLGLVMFFVTFCYTDIWPKKLWSPLHTFYASKTLGALALWMLSGVWLCLPRESQARQSVR